MNQTVEMYFPKLVEKRLAYGAAHETEHAHETFETYGKGQFLYDLLQLADDAGSMAVRFVLEPRRLIFSYDGRAPFTITDPDTERTDLRNGSLGDINALTGLSFLMSGADYKLGRINVGLKSVFKYASSFEVYNQALCFRVNQQYVPEVLPEDASYQKKGTQIIIPFDAAKLPCREACTDIAYELQHLSHPQLFLSHVQYVVYTIDNQLGSYNKMVLHHWEADSQTKVKKIRMIQQFGESPAVENDFWVFKRHSDEGTCAVGFHTDATGNLNPVTEKARCTFPTKTETGLHFLVQAPFRMSRGTYRILDDNEYNQKLIRTLIHVATDALSYFKQIETETGERILTDAVYSVIPLEKQEHIPGPFGKWQPQFYEAIHEAFLTQPIIPTQTGYVDRTHAYWAANTSMLQLFSDKKLCELLDKPDVGWIYPIQGYEAMGKDKGKQALFEYLDSLAILNVSEEALVRGNYINYKTATKNFPGINKKFIEKQTDVWLISFYRWLLERKNCWQNWYVLKTKPIFLDQQRHAVAAYNAHTVNPGIFVPLPGTENLKKQPLPVINQGLADAISTQSLLDHFNIRSYSEKDYIYCVIVPAFNQSKGTESKDIDCEKFKRLFDFYRHGTHGEQQELCTKLKSCKFLIAKDYTGKTHYNQKVNQVYLLANTEIGLPNHEEHDNYGNPLRYINLPRYIKAVGKGNKQELCFFLEKLGVEKRKERIKSNPQSGGKPPIPPHADDILKQIYLSQKMLKRCPFDNYLLYERSGYVKRNDGYEKKVKVLSCPLCHKSFMQNNSVPRKLYDRDYDIVLDPIIGYSDGSDTPENGSITVINPIDPGLKPGNQIGLMKFKTLIISHNPYVQCIAGHKTMKRSEIQFDCKNGSNKTLKVRICLTCHRVYLEKKEIPADIDFTALNVHLLSMNTAKKIIDHVISLDTLNQKMEELESEGKRIFSPERGTGIVIKNGIPLKGTTNRKETVIAVKFLEDLDKIRYFRENVAFKNHDLIFY